MSKYLQYVLFGLLLGVSGSMLSMQKDLSTKTPTIAEELANLRSAFENREIKNREIKIKEIGFLERLQRWFQRPKRKKNGDLCFVLPVETDRRKVAVVSIILGVVVIFGGKKLYDYIKNKNNKTSLRNEKSEKQGLLKKMAKQG